MRRSLPFIVLGFLAIFALPALWTPVPSDAQEIMPTPRPSPSPTHPVPVVRVRASAHDGNRPSNTVDNDLSTRWSARGDGAWVEYDLGSTTKVAAVQIAVFRGNTRSNTFEVRLSTDRTHWRTAFDGSSRGTTTLLETYDFLDQDARYVRYVGHGNVSAGRPGTWNSLTEVAILSTQSSTAPVPQNVQALAMPGGIEVSWSPVPEPGLTLYRVYRAATSGGPYFNFRNDTGTRVIDPQGTDGVRYCYVVTYGLGRVESRYSNEVCATATSAPSP